MKRLVKRNFSTGVYLPVFRYKFEVFGEKVLEKLENVCYNIYNDLQRGLIAGIGRLRRICAVPECGPACEAAVGLRRVTGVC